MGERRWIVDRGTVVAATIIDDFDGRPLLAIDACGARVVRREADIYTAEAAAWTALADACDADAVGHETAAARCRHAAVLARACARAVEVSDG